MKDRISKLFYLYFFVLAVIVIFPILTLLFNLDLEGVKKTFADHFFWSSLLYTLLTAFVAAVLCVLLAIGFGYFHLFHKRSIYYKILNFFNELPVALPHTVAGLALLIAFGRGNFGFVGPTGLAFSLFAVILAMTFVSYPLAARAVCAGLDQLDKNLILIARTLGDTPVQAYFRVSLPLIKQGLFSSFFLTFARSVSEFAAVVLFGGNVPDSTQVLASYVFSKVEEGELSMAITAGAVCLVLSAVLAILALRKRGQHA